jgi:uncharacterized protein YgiM (DUF1202 family)
MSRLFLAIFIVFCALASVARAQDEAQQVVVEDPFIEMRTGPAQAYPVFYVVDRGEPIEVLSRRTDWFKVRAPRGQEGWVNSLELQETLQLSGEPVEVPGFTLADHAVRRWEVGALYGDFDGANIVSVYGAYSFTENLSAEIWYSDILGNFSNSQLAGFNIVHLLYPEWRVSPYFTLGGGIINTEPKGTIVATTDRTDNIAHVGIGIRTYLTRRFVFRAEYKTYVVFTSRDDNEEPTEWKAGFSFFF